MSNDLTEDELDLMVLKRLRRDPIPFIVLTGRLRLDSDVLSSSLRRLLEAGRAEICYGRGWRLPPRSRKMTRKEALGVVLDAAANWANEMTEYIIPADAPSDYEDADEDSDKWTTTANRNAEVARIDEAVKLLSTKKKEE